MMKTNDASVGKTPLFLEFDPTDTRIFSLTTEGFLSNLIPANDMSLNDETKKGNKKGKMGLNKLQPNPKTHPSYPRVCFSCFKTSGLEYVESCGKGDWTCKTHKKSLDVHLKFGY